MILAANRCRDRSPNIYIADSLSEVSGILNPRLGDVAMLISGGSFETWRLTESDAEPDGINVIASNACEFKWIISAVGEGGVDVVAFGADPTGQQDSREAFELAMQVSCRVYAPTGTYLIDGPLSVLEGREIYGDGISCTTIRQSGIIPASQGTFYVNSGDAATQVSGIYIHDLTVDGQSDTLGFSEFYHLISLNGVKNATIERVKLRAFRGDGIYVGSGDVAGQERHNTNVWIKSCEFDGVDYSNRNGASVIDWDGCYIVDSYFTRCSAPTMPGPIDFEPDPINAAFAVMRNAFVERCQFVDCGGLSGKIAVYIPVLTSAANPATGFRIRDNWIEGTGGGGATTAFFVRFFENGTPTLTTEAMATHDVEISGNRVDGNSSEIYGARSVTVSGNTFTGLGKNSLVVGSLSTNSEGNVIDPVIERNSFISTGGGFGATTIGNVLGLKLRFNHYRDISQAQATKLCIAFVGSGVTTTSSGLIEKNTFSGTYNLHIFQTSNTTTDENTFLIGNTAELGAPIITNLVCNRSVQITGSATPANNVRLYADTGNLVVRDGVDAFADITSLSLRLSDRAFIHSEAPDVVGIHNGANPCSLYVFNFKTDSTNFERIGFRWDTNVARLDVEASGTGVQRVFLSNADRHIFRAAGSSDSVTFDANGVAGNTRLLVYDVNSGALQRVKVGANGTGPGGVGRALYIDNM